MKKLEKQPRSKDAFTRLDDRQMQNVVGGGGGLGKVVMDSNILPT